MLATYNELLTLLAAGTGETKTRIHLEGIGIDSLDLIKVDALVETGLFSALAVLL